MTPQDAYKDAAIRLVDALVATMDHTLAMLAATLAEGGPIGDLSEALEADRAVKAALQAASRAAFGVA